MQPVEVQIEGGMKQMFVDGGLVDSYPLHVYDGMFYVELFSLLLYKINNI